MPQWQGFTKSGEACGGNAEVRRQYCKWHPSCIGNKKDGTKCFKRATTGNKYCSFHPFCQGIKKNGLPCYNRAEPLRRFCPHHPFCAGTRSTGSACYNPVREGEKYCRVKAHNPLNHVSNVKEFRLDRCRELRGTAVLERDLGMDAYSGESVVAVWKKNESTTNDVFTCVELEHTNELHVARDIVDRVIAVCKPTSEQFVSFKEIVKANFNMLENLNFTHKDINAIKYEGVHNFLYDYWDDVSGDTGLFNYLDTAAVTDKQSLGRTKLTRRISGAICKETLASYDKIIDNFNQENVHESSFCDEFSGLVIDGMRLK